MTTPFHIELVDETWEHFGKVMRLDFEVLYKNAGIAEDSDWLHGGIPSVFSVACSGERVLGSARLLGEPGDSERQLRQVVVEPTLRRLGVGRALVEALENVAREQGADEIWLNARETAYEFYGRLGYTFDSETFISELTRIPHRSMRKRLGVDR